MERLYLIITNILISLNFHTSENPFFANKFKEEIKEHFKNFLWQGSLKPDLNIDIMDFANNEVLRKKIKNKNKDFIFLAKENSKKNISISYKISLFQFQEFLKIIILNSLSKKNSLMLHSSAVNYRGKAILFLGKSTAGKSTAVNLLNPEFRAIADDSVIINKEKSKYYLFQTPFVEKNFKIYKDRTKYEIRCVFFLKKASYFKISKIENKDFITETLIEQLWTKQEILKVQIKNVLGFCQKGNFYNLYFAKEKKGFVKLMKTI